MTAVPTEHRPAEQASAPPQTGPNIHQRLVGFFSPENICGACQRHAAILIAGTRRLAPGDPNSLPPVWRLRAIAFVRTGRSLFRLDSISLCIGLSMIWHGSFRAIITENASQSPKPSDLAPEPPDLGQPFITETIGDTVMGEERLFYRGYRLGLFRVGPGWRVLIHAPGKNEPMPEAPISPREEGRQQVISEAQGLIERNLPKDMTQPPPSAPSQLRPRPWWRTMVGIGRNKS
jgi:hypothetical protein